MDSFTRGFIKYAADRGLTQKQAFDFASSMQSMKDGFGQAKGYLGGLFDKAKTTMEKGFAQLPPDAGLPIGGEGSVMSNAPMMGTPQPPIQPTPPPPSPPVIKPDWAIDFKKYHGTAFDPNSRMDRFKMQQLQQAQQQGRSLVQAANIPYKTAFDRGYIKAANERLEQARAKDKEEKDHSSSMLGRWFSQKAQRGQASQDHMTKSILGGGAGGILGGSLGSLAGGTLGAGLGALVSGGDNSNPEATKALMALLGGGGAYGGARLGEYIGGGAGGSLASQGFNPEKRQNTLDDSTKTLDNRSIIENALIGGGKGALAGGLMGLPVGAGVGALMQNAPGADSAGVGPGIGALLGLGVGALGGGLGAGLRGGFNSLVHQNTTNETKERAKQQLVKHPIIGSLPFGDVHLANKG